MHEFDDRSPIYLQIAEQIRRDVATGELGEGDQVMSTTQYATTYRINPATANRAMALLVAEGVVHKQRGVRSEERRVGKECPLLCRSRWSPYH